MSLNHSRFGPTTRFISLTRYRRYGELGIASCVITIPVPQDSAKYSITDLLKPQFLSTAHLHVTMPDTDGAHRVPRIEHRQQQQIKLAPVYKKTSIRDS